jgi:hypothetical protein
MTNFYRFYGAPPRRFPDGGESLESYIAAEKRSAEGIGQRLSEDDLKNIKRIWKN